MERVSEIRKRACEREAHERADGDINVRERLFRELSATRGVKKVGEVLRVLK